LRISPVDDSLNNTNGIQAESVMAGIGAFEFNIGGGATGTIRPSTSPGMLTSGFEVGGRIVRQRSARFARVDLKSTAGVKSSPWFVDVRQSSPALLSRFELHLNSDMALWLVSRRAEPPRRASSSRSIGLLAEGSRPR
jgi:hypothetical protein